jgi:lipoprotein-anchoring transpeptidase ErfK/SrfK
MRLRGTVPLLAMLIVGCSGTVTAAAEHPPLVAIPVAPEPVAATTAHTDRVVDAGTPVWAGFDATTVDPPALAVYARGPVDIYATPADTEPFTTVEPLTILGTVTVLGVVSGPQDGWAQVMLPMRPNGSTGWVRADDVWFYAADGEIIVDLTERRLSYVVDGLSVLETEIGVGSRYNRTPTGLFFVTDNVALAEPGGPWGPRALGLSARSDSITSFNGGDGIIGIHGTNNPSSIGSDISLGCIRLPNDVITRLSDLVPIGTRVEIRA